MKKILFYNWVMFCDEENRGGGVTVYQRNVIEKLIEDQVAEPYFIYSGIEYTLSVQEPHFKKVPNNFGEKCHSYALVNSPVMSPGHFNFGGPDIYLKDESLLRLFVEFMKQNGPFDVVHFNNFEGLTLNVMRLKEYFPDTKFIYSVHNYYTFCPQVNLWKKEKASCEDCHNGRDCINCVPGEKDYVGIMRANQLAWAMKRAGIKPKTKLWAKGFANWNFCWRQIDRYLKLTNRKLQNPQLVMRKGTMWSSIDYRLFREKNVEYLNRYIDTVLAVSDRVREITVNMGVDESKVFTSYIGTKFGETQLGKSVAEPSEDGTLNVIYMGYARRDKGFFFLKKAIKSLPPEIGEKIRLTLAVRLNDDAETFFMMKKLSAYLGGLRHVNGYTHKDLPTLLKDVHLGIVPVMWEDNLPQVAIELAAHGVPVLASDMGGASELTKSEHFRYKGGDTADFIQKLGDIVADPALLEDYWKQAMTLVTMDAHMKELYRYYGFSVDGSDTKVKATV